METIKLYVDAGNSHRLIEHEKPYTIGIFNENNGFKRSLNLRKVGLTIHDAEKLAIIYAITYLRMYKKKIEKHIYSDSKNNVENKFLKEYCNNYNIELIWINRDENKIADSLTRSKECKSIKLKTLGNILKIKNKIEINKKKLQNK